MAASLDELLVERTLEDELNSLLGVLQSKGFPVSDYLPGGAAHTVFLATAFGLADFSKLLPLVAAGGFATLAKDLEDPVWLDLIAEFGYDIQRARATFTRQVCRVSCLGGFGPKTVNPGFVVQSPATGNRYIYQGGIGVVVGDASFSDIEFTAEFSGAKYGDGADTITRVITPLSGLSVNNPNRKFGGIDAANAAKKNSANQGSGTVTPSAAGTPALTRFYTVIVIASGQAGASGSVQVSYEQGGTKTTLPTQTPIPTTYAGAGDGVTLTFANGAGSGFSAGDLHTFTTPGSPVTSAGTDDETQESLYLRCIGRWPSLSENIVADKYEAWIRQCSIDNALGVEKMRIRPSTTVAGQTDILVATAAGAPAGIATLQNYVNARDGITDAAEVKAASEDPITLAGTITVHAAQIDAVKAAADENWTDYLLDLPIGGDTSTGSPGVVRLAELVEAIMKAGAIDHSGLQLNGAATNYALATDAVATIDNVPSALTFLTVA